MRRLSVQSRGAGHLPLASGHASFDAA